MEAANSDLSQYRHKITDTDSVGPSAALDWHQARFFTEQNRFTQYIRNPSNGHAPDNIESRRLIVYRDLFFNNIQGFLANAFPVIKKLYDKDDWLRMVRHFFQHHSANTPYRQGCSCAPHQHPIP